MMQGHQANIELFQQNTESLLNSAEQSLKSLQVNVQRTTENAINQMAETKLSLISVQAESQNLAQLLQQQTQRNSDTFEPTGRAARAVKSPISSIEQHEPRNSRNSQDQENPFYIKYSFSFDSSYFAYISIALGYVSKSKYNDINEMQNKVDYLKSQGGSMFTMECGETVRRVRPERKKELHWTMGRDRLE